MFGLLQNNHSFTNMNFKDEHKIFEKQKRGTSLCVSMLSMCYFIECNAFDIALIFTNQHLSHRNELMNKYLLSKRPSYSIVCPKTVGIFKYIYLEIVIKESNFMNIIDKQK